MTVTEWKWAKSFFATTRGSYRLLSRCGRPLSRALVSSGPNGEAVLALTIGARDIRLRSADFGRAFFGIRQVKDVAAGLFGST
jgi:hypothetical protein